MDIDRSTIWPYKDGEPGEFIYQRYGHPTGVEAERRLGELDGGHALLFSSGSGAATALVLTFLSSGETIALAEGAYFGTGVLFRELERWGLRVVEFDQTGTPPGRRRPRLARGAVESLPHDARPRVRGRTSRTRRRRRHRRDADPPAAARARRRLRPAQRHEVPRRPRRRAARRRRLQARGGRRAAEGVPDPLGHRRGARPVRPAPARTRDARAARPAADGVRGRAGTAAARRIPRSRSCATPASAGCSPSTSRAPTRPATSRRRSALITNATSLGGIHSLLEARARWEGDRVPPGLLRLSVGLEPVEDSGPIWLRPWKFQAVFPRASKISRP